MSRTLLMASACALTFGAAAVADDEGFYLGAGLGVGMMDDLDVRYEADPSTEITYDGESDLLETLNFGYVHANGWRTELEASHRWNDLGAFNDIDGSADAHMWSLMANAIYDTNPNGVVKPYVGAGVGATQLVYSGEGTVSGTPVNVDDDEVVFAGQALAGVAWRVAPKWELDAGYRYFFAPEAKFHGAAFDGAYEHHDVLVGVRYMFGGSRSAPAPAAPPAPPTRAPVAAPAAACDDVDFVVYFEWDEADLTNQASATVRTAAEQAEACDVVRVGVEGHTDRSGPAAYNAGLSQRRANVVRDALIRAGVPASVITVEAKGETDLAVETPDGVREPLNRRSAVVIVVDGPNA